MEAAKSFIFRKLSTTFVATFTFSFLLVIYFISLDGFNLDYNLGDQFISWFFFYSLYIGAIILFYGNLVSIVVEEMQSKWFPQHHWLYILILGMFGLANGLFFQMKSFALLGMLAAIIYGIIDKWLLKRFTKEKNIKMFFIIPTASLVISWGILQVVSPPKPLFTIGDAVHLATSGNSTVIAQFPEDIGKWEGDIKGYQVTRETNAKQIEKAVYIVSFTEKWQKGNEMGTRILSYKVERGSLKLKRKQGEKPPYD